MSNWTVDLSRDAKKQYKKLEKSGLTKPSIIDVIDLLVMDLQMNGPHLLTWPNYGSLKESHFHCHLRRGKPTFVACWEVVDKRAKKIEVYYVGSHEAAPY